MADAVTYTHVFRIVFQNDSDKWLYYRTPANEEGGEPVYLPVPAKYAEEYKIRFQLELGEDPNPPKEPEPDPDPEPETPEQPE